MKGSTGKFLAIISQRPTTGDSNPKAPYPQVLDAFRFDRLRMHECGVRLRQSAATAALTPCPPLALAGKEEQKQRWGVPHAPRAGTYGCPAPSLEKEVKKGTSLGPFGPRLCQPAVRPPSALVLRQAQGERVRDAGTIAA